MPLFPLESGLFPGGFISLRIFEIRYLEMIKKAIKNKSSFGLVMLMKGSEVRKPGVVEEFMSENNYTNYQFVDLPNNLTKNLPYSRIEGYMYSTKNENN